MKKFAIRIFYKVVNPFRRSYWFFVRPQSRGVKCIVEHEGKVLLVKLSYGPKHWTLPGGGVGKKETFREAGIREAKEEVGINLKDPQKIHEYVTDHEYKVVTLQVFHSEVEEDSFDIDQLEIVDAKWHNLKDSLPKPTSPSLVKILEKLRDYKNVH